MDPQVFNRFRKLIYEKSGITLGPQKVALVSARIAKRMRALGIQDHAEYLKYVENDTTGQEVVQMLDAISTNVTSFFREPQHFDLLRELLETWLAQGMNRLRIWCAAASTGEEPYTIAMIVSEVLGGRSTDFRMLATDISTRVLEACKRGEYPASRMEPVPIALRNRYFTRIEREGETYYRVIPELLRPITFSRLNLSQTPFPMKGPFDVVFCRNVMIYFDLNVRKRLVDEIFRLLRPGGYLMIGHSESLNACNSSLRPVRASVYRKP